MKHFTLAPERPVYVHIEKTEDQYTGRIHQDDPDRALRLPEEVALGPAVRPVDAHKWTLKDLVTAIVRYQKSDLAAFDERVQLDVGNHLYKETLGRLPESVQETLRNQQDLHVRIITDDEWIASLPWNLLVCKGVFCCAIGWAVSVCRRLPHADCDLPPSPRLLVIAPQPKGVPDTFARDHLEALEDMLSGHDPKLSAGKHLKIVTTWDEYVRIVPEFRPELIYFYGHGIGDSRKAKLVFAENETVKRIDKPIMDFAHPLRQLQKSPLLAYINCCQGDAGGFLGAGMTLGDVVPAVITNRTVAEMDVAQAQAMKLWEQVLFQAVPPHKAAANLYTGMDLQRLTFADFRWITPVLHAHYDRWKSKPPTLKGRLTPDPHWHLKIDRVKQYDRVFSQTFSMIQEQKPKSLVFTWYGLEGDGVELFHRRLLIELREKLAGADVYPIRPSWPDHLADYETAFGDRLCEAFGVQTLEDIPARLRAETHGRTTLLYVRHEPVRSRKLINPATLKDYVAWWDAEFAPLLEKKQFGLLTVSFLVNNPPAFAEYVKKQRINEQDLKHSVFWLLDEMENIAREDLVNFMRTHNIDLPTDRRDDVIFYILKRTQGRYEQTVEELKNLRQHAWRVKRPASARTPATEELYDY